jgi:hypothetical protein
LAWPAVALAAVLIFRHRLRELLGERLRSLKAGPVEATWADTVAQTTVAVELDEASRDGEPFNLDDVADANRGSEGLDWWRLVSTRKLPALYDHMDSSPELAVIGGWILVEEALRNMLTSRAVILVPAPRLASAGIDLRSPRNMTETAFTNGLISYDMYTAILGMIDLRNQLAHAHDSVTTERALEYLDLVRQIVQTLVSLTIQPPLNAGG